MNFYPPPKEVWEQGNCRSTDSDLFYPDRDSDTYMDVSQQAKKYCHGFGRLPRCPVLLQCLLYGLVTEDRFGIWGGMTPRERNWLRRSRDLSKYQQAAVQMESPYYGLVEGYLHGLSKEREENGD